MRVLGFLTLLLLSQIIARAQNWPQWRGPSLNGVSNEKNLPVKWTTEENVAWKISMPGWTGSTPIIWRDRIFLNVAEGDNLYLWCVDKTKGEVLWKKPLGGGNVKMRKQNMSSPSPVTDGSNVYVMTGTGILKGFDFDGKELWSRDIQKDYGEFGLNWGYASSPLLFEDSLYVQVLHGMKTDAPSYVLRVDNKSGKTLWKVERPTTAIRESPDSYTTPALLRYGKTTEIVITGGDCVTGHDPATGKELWRANGLNPDNDPSYRIVASPMVYDGIVYAPTRVRPLLALKAGGRGDVTSSHVLWSTVNGPDVPTPVTDGKYFYVVNDRGIMFCYDAKTGAEIYGQQRIKPGTYSSSPVLADGKVYITNEDGLTTVVAAGPKFEVLAENPLNDYVLSSPAISEGRIYIRTAQHLYAIGAQKSQLGQVEFPTSGSPKAQQYFLRGLAALHSFWYEEAIEAFRESTKDEPDFAMGYWGEAMAYNHPLWSEQDIATARQVLAKIKETSKLTERERAYIGAVRLLYGDGDKHARDIAYSNAMEKIYRAYPDDLDAAAFYALSLLGIGGEKGYRLQAKAGAIALDVYQKNPNHPGAAHYIIHAFDDPDHAILALPAARRYASIAPEAHHARHMPSHIFLQLGMWPEAAASNESAWEASDSWMKRKNLSPSVRDYHSLHWLLYVYLQQGRYNDAEKLLNLMKKVMSESTYDNKLRPGYYENNYANMAAAFIVETERWNLATELFPESKATATSDDMGAHGAHGNAGATMRTSYANKTLPLFVRGLAAAMTGAEIKSDELRSKAEINELEIEAVNASMKKDYDKAIELMKKATALEEDMRPPSGPPSLVKPTHELFGEILLRAGKPADAAEMFKVSLQRQPNRARSLLGAARAAAQTGNQSAALTAYAALVEQWKQADTGLSELREARDYLKQAKR